MSEAGEAHRRIGWAIAVWAGLQAGTSSAAAQSARLVSPITQVRLVVIVPPQVVPAAVAQPSGVVWRTAEGTGLASITLSANMSYRLIAHRDASRESGGRIWVEGEDGLAEVTDAEPVLVRRGTRTESAVLVPVRLSPRSDGSVVAQTLPVRFEVLVEPTL